MGDGLLEGLVELRLADDQQGRRALVEHLAELHDVLARHAVPEVADDAAREAADGDVDEQPRREEDAEDGACGYACPGAVLRRLLALVHIHLAVRVLGDDGGVVRADHAGGVQLLDGGVVELRVGLRVVRGGEDEDGFVGHVSLLCLPGRPPVASPGGWDPVAIWPDRAGPQIPGSVVTMPRRGKGRSRRIAGRGRGEVHTWMRRETGADARNRTEDPIITSRPRPCLWCPFGLHTASYSATISTVSHRHVGKMSAGKGDADAVRRGDCLTNIVAARGWH